MKWSEKLKSWKDRKGQTYPKGTEKYTRELQLPWSNQDDNAKINLTYLFLNRNRRRRAWRRRMTVWRRHGGGGPTFRRCGSVFTKFVY